MKIEERVYKEAIKAAFDNYKPNTWLKNLKVMVFDSLIYNVRDFGIILDKETILYSGYEISKAYWSGYAPLWEELKNISYIKDYNTDNYIFFDENGKELNGGYTFDKVDNMNRQIVARSIDSEWYTITKSGPRLFGD